MTYSCIGPKWPMDQMADGHLDLGLNGRWSFVVGLNDRFSHLRPVTSPGLKLLTQSQMADENPKVPSLKVCVKLPKFHCKNLEMYKFHCFHDHYTLLK